MLNLPATIGLTEAKAAMRPLTEGASREPSDRLKVDAAGLQQFDSSALAVLLECQRLAQASGRGFVVRGAPAKLGQLATLYGMDELLLPTCVAS